MPENRKQPLILAFVHITIALLLTVTGYNCSFGGHVSYGVLPVIEEDHALSIGHLDNNILVDEEKPLPCLPEKLPLNEEDETEDKKLSEDEINGVHTSNHKSVVLRISPKILTYYLVFAYCQVSIPLHILFHSWVI